MLVEKKINMDVSVYNHISMCEECGIEPVNSMFIKGCSSITITNDHVLDYITESRDKFDLILDEKLVEIEQKVEVM